MPNSCSWPPASRPTAAASTPRAEVPASSKIDGTPGMPGRVAYEVPAEDEAPRRRLTNMRDYMDWLEIHHAEMLKAWLAYKQLGNPVAAVAYASQLQKITELEDALLQSPQELAVRQAYQARVEALEAKLEDVPLS